MNSMSFGDLPFAGGHVRKTQETCQKYTKNLAKQTPDMSLKGEGPLTRQIKAQVEKKGQNPYQINSKWRQTLQDPSRGPMKTTDQRWGNLGPVGVWPHPV